MSNIQQVVEQSFDLDLLGKGTIAIDIGTGIDFTISKALVDLGCKVIGVDPNPNIIKPFEHPNFKFYPNAIVTDETLENTILNVFNDPEGTTTKQVIFQDVPYLQHQYSVSVPTITMPKLMEENGIDQADLIAFNAEGIEYEILSTIFGPVAKQISVSFHDFRGMNPCFPNNEQYYEKLFETLKEWYVIVKHVKEVHPGMPTNHAINYWDSLFILKEYVDENTKPINIKR